MEIIQQLILSGSLAFSVENLLYCFIGVFLGTLVGVIPGLGPATSMSVLLPFVLSISNPITAIIFLAGIYYGTQYGGSITAILLKLPGEASSIVIVKDGYSLTQAGKAGTALSLAAIGSFIGGCVSTLVIAFFAIPASNIAFYFGPTEYAALMMLGLLAVVSLGTDSFLKGFSMVLIGLLLSTIGFDVNSGTERMTFGIFELGNGLPFVILIMSLFGVSEAIYFAIQKQKEIVVENLKNFKSSDMYPTREEIKTSINPILRGTVIGSILGVIPGAGPILSSIVSYTIEKRISKTPERFGKGAIEGVAGPESANNAAAQTSFIPLLSFGIPTGPTMAIMLSVLLILGLQPGPQLISSNPGMFWTLIVSMWIGNLFLIILNLPLIKIWTSVLKIPQNLLYVIIFFTCIWSAYVVTDSWFFVMLLLPLSAIAVLFKLLDCDPSPILLSFVIGKMFEEYFRRSLIISRGDWMIFLEKPLSLALITIAVLMVIMSIVYKRKQ
jgi:TctA family transporter